MTTQNLPGTNAARHGTGDADLTIMIAAHDAFRRDLTRLARTASAANLSDPARRQPIAAADLPGLDDFVTPLGELRTLPCHWPDADPRMSGLDGFFAARLERL